MKQNLNEVGSGILDPNFGVGGVVDLAFEAQSRNSFHSALALTNNQVLYADKEGQSGTVIRLRRLNANGSFDRDFGLNGSVNVSIGEGRFLYTAELCHYSDDKWLLSGVYIESQVMGVYVVRQHLNGDLDTSFNSTGIMTLDPLALIGAERRRLPKASEEFAENPFLAASTSARGIAVQPDGKIVMLYSFLGLSDLADAIVIRFNPDGALDTSFQGVGYAFVELEGTHEEKSSAERIAIQQDGKIVVQGTFSGPQEVGCFVTRFNEVGQLDTSFNNGRAVKILHSNANFSRIGAGGLTIRESDGAIALVDTAISNSGHIGLIAVLNNTGSLHPDFNGGEVLFSNMLAEGVGWNDVVWQEEPQAIVVFGSGGVGNPKPNFSVVMARYFMNGSLDPSFNGRGWTVYKHDSGYGFYKAMIAPKDSKLTLCAHVQASTITHGFLLRYV